MSKPLFALLYVFLFLSAVPSTSAAGNAALPGEIIQELPTLRCLGVQWRIGGDDNRNARVIVGYRKAGSARWNRGLDLFRVDSRAVRADDRPPAGQTLLAGSIFYLDEDTQYEIKLVLQDPDGGNAQRTMTMKTWAEPQLPTEGRKIDVYPVTSCCCTRVSIAASFARTPARRDARSRWWVPAMVMPFSMEAAAGRLWTATRYTT